MSNPIVLACPTDASSSGRSTPPPWHADAVRGRPSHHGRQWPKTNGEVGPRTIGADPVRGEQRLVFQRLAEEALSRVEITLRGEQEVDRVSVLVDGPVQIAPLTANLDVCLIDPDRAAMGFAKGPQPALDQG